MNKTTPFDNEFGNITKYGIYNDAVRFTWAGYYLFVTLSSLIGDTTILVASIKYKAIKLHRTIVIIIKHLAVCDLLVASLQTMPMFVTFVADKWVFGEVVCYVRSFAPYYFGTTSVLLICTMVTYKLLLLEYPFKLGTRSSKNAHMICGACWGIASIMPITMSLVSLHDVHFSYLMYTCFYDFFSDSWTILGPSLAAIFVMSPIFVVMVASIKLLLLAKRVARRERKSLKWQGLMTTILTATVYSVSLLPWFGWGAIVAASEGIQKHLNAAAINRTYSRVAISLTYLNTMCNFYIYCLTVTGFRNFVWSRLQYPFQKLNFLITGTSVLKFDGTT